MTALHHSLPPQPTPFVGREDELTAIGKMLEDPGHRLITILGPGGMGKTRLSLAVAERQLTNKAFVDGIFFVPLAGLEDSDRIVSVIAEAMRLRLEQGESQLLGHLRAKQVLLLLDNFEHLLDGSGLVNRLLEASPGLQILITSRERLRLQGEQVYPIHGLSVDDDAAMDDARQLFLQAAGRVRPDIQQTNENLPLLNRICRLVEGMPLALVLAAAWVDLLTLGDIAAEIERNLDFLETDLRDLPTRHRSMRAVFDTSWQNLAPNIQQLMAQVSVFRRGFTREAAASVAKASLHQLADLVSKSLLSFDPTANRYHIHELLRQYSVEQLPTIDARGRHSAYYLDWLIQQSEELIGPNQDEAVARIDLEMDNIRAAINHALRRRDVDNFVQVMRTVEDFYASQSRLEEAVLLLDHIRTELVAAPETPSYILFWATALQVSALGTMGKTVESRELWREGQSYLADLASHGMDFRAEEAYAKYVEGFHLYTNQPSKSRQLLRQSCDLWIELGDSSWAARTLMVQARAARNQGDLEAAEALVNEALTLFRILNDQHSVVRLQLLAGNLAAIDGRYDEAECTLLKGIKAERSLNRPWMLANGGLGKLQMVYCFSGRFEEAQAPLAECRQLCQEYGWPWGLAQTGVSFALLQLQIGHYSEAQRESETTIGLVHEHGLPDFFTCEALTLLAQAQIAIGNYEKAEAFLRESESLCDSRPVGIATYVAGNDLYWGIAAAARGDSAIAWKHVRRELKTAACRTDRLNLANAIAGKAYLHAVENEASLALEAYSLAQQHPFVAHSRWFADVVGHRVHEAVSNLSPSETDLIMQRSTESDLETAAAAILAQSDVPKEKKPVVGTAPVLPLLDPLSERELELLQLVAAGKSNREIAAELFLALGTVKSHLHNIYQKLDAANRTQAINRAKALDLL